MSTLTTNSLIAGARALSAELSWLTLRRAIIIEYGIMLFFICTLRGRRDGSDRNQRLASAILSLARDILISLISTTVLCFFVAWLVASHA